MEIFGNGPRVLVAETKPDTFQIVSEFLVRAGIPFVTVDRSDEVVELFKTRNIDILITSFKEPEEDCLTLKHWCTRSGIPVPVVFTSEKFQSLAADRDILRHCCLEILNRRRKARLNLS